MEFRIFQTRIRVHPLMLMMPLLACRLGLKVESAALAIALCVHECAHLAAAAGLRVSIPEMTIMPFGGSACIGNPYILSPVQLGLTALAGPLSNLLMIIMSAALAHWSILPPMHSAVFVRINLMLMLFNLLPALPLDGGRILYALLCDRLGRDKAVAIGIWLGRLLAAFLLSRALCMLIQQSLFNLSYLFAAIFLLSCAPAERRALNSFTAHALVSALSPVSSPVPVNLSAADAACPVYKALRAARPGCVNLYAVYKDGAFSGFTDDRTLLEDYLDSGPARSVGHACRNIKTSPGGLV